MNKKKRKKKQPFFASHEFIEGKTSYDEEYRLWRTAKILKNLIGAYDVPFNDYMTRKPEQLLKLVKHAGLTVIAYDSEEPAEEYYQPSPNAERPAGYTCGLRTPYGKVKSIIFLREVSFPAEMNLEIRAINKLGILMHEMGHAEDIDKSINYDHQRPSFDPIAAEVHAHTFVLKHARRLGYRQLLFSYCLDLEEDLHLENDIYRKAAERMWDSFDIRAIKRATGFH